MRKILKNKNLILFLIGSFVSGIGTKLTTVALSDKILRLTASDFSISMVFLLQSAPMLILGAASGNFIEKKNKKVAFIAINSIFSCTSLLFAFSNNAMLLYSVMLINGILQTLFIPTRVALLPLIVDAEDIVNANALRVSINGIIMILGYAFAGLLVGYAGSTAAFLIDSLSFIFIALSFILVKPKFNNRLSNDSHFKSSYKSDMKEGWDFIKNTRSIKDMFILDIITNFIISMQIPLTYVFVKTYLGGEAFMAKRTGLLFSAAGVGTILGSAFLGKFKDKNKSLLLSTSLIFDSTFIVMFTFSRHFNISIIIYGAMGIIGAFTGTLLETIIQENTPQNLLGRVSGFINTVVEPLSVLSILIGGSISQFIEVKWVFIICSALELMTGIYFTFKYKL